MEKIALIAMLGYALFGPIGAVAVFAPYLLKVMFLLIMIFVGLEKGYFDA